MQSSSEHFASNFSASKKLTPVQGVQPSRRNFSLYGRWWKSLEILVATSWIRPKQLASGIICSVNTAAKINKHKIIRQMTPAYQYYSTKRYDCGLTKQ